MDYTNLEEGTTSAALPEYNTNNVKTARLQSTLLALLTDPLLADVPNKPTLSDVDTLINLELGSAMRITVLKMDGSSFGMSNFLTWAFSQIPYLNVANGNVTCYLICFVIWLWT